MIDGDTSLAAAWWMFRPMLAEQWRAAVADPGWMGFVVGGLLILLAAGLLSLRFARRRADAEAVAEMGPSYPPGVWPAGWDDATLLIPRCTDDPNATAVLPRVRQVRRG